MESGASSEVMTGYSQENGLEVSGLETDLKNQSVTISMLSERLRELESILPANDDVLSQTIDTLTSTVKNLAHNQRTLESKLDDLLKNQTNTDVAINEISSRLENLMGVFQNNTSSLGVMFNRQASSSGNASYQAKPAPTRGPGRPKKNQSVVTTSLPNGASYSRIQLPMNNISIPKSKRHLITPSQEPLKKEASAPAQQENPPPPPRRRGRPPKKKNLAATSFASSKIGNVSGATSNATPLKSVQSSGALSSNTQDKDNESTTVRGKRTAVAPTVSLRSSRRSTRARRQRNFYDEDSDASENISRSESQESEDEDGDEEDEEEDNSQEDSSYEESTSKNTSSRVPKLSHASNNLKQEDENGDDLSEVQSAPGKSRRQLELERRRDPREKMLVSMKYSDRDKAKSFMESNKDLLKAMKEEERKKRMTAINYEPIYNNSLQQTIRQVQSNANVPPPLSSSTQAPLPQSSDSNRTVTADASSLSYPNSEPRRMGILSMLNSHEPSPSQTANASPQEAPTINATTATSSATPEKYLSSGNKRLVDDSDSVTLTPTKRSKGSPSTITAGSTVISSAPASGYTANYTTVSSTPATTAIADSTKNSNIHVTARGRPSNTNNSSDNSAALLMASPIELVCKDGYFYRRNDLTTPITTGNYLGMKFKNKEEELIKMTMHEDYTELTRHDRINAYFMKPDIDIETEYACQVLSNVTLTERYVNSLEYFLMEFRWENRLVSLGLKLRESKRTWQRRKALFALFEFWRDKSREKRGFSNYTIFHAVKEMENYRVFINRSVSWFYNHITLLKMILFDLCDNTDTQWREWMFPKDCRILVEDAEAGVTKSNINQLIDTMLTLDFLEDGTENLHTKSSAA